MKIVLTHPTGNANVKAAASGLMRAEILYRFQTSIASFSGDLLDTLGGYRPLAEIRRRRFDSILRPITETWPLLETGRLMASKAGFNRLIKHETGVFSIDSVYKGFDRKVASSLKQLSKKGANAVYAYEDAAELTFKEAKMLGLKCYYDLPIGYWRTARQLLKTEQERWPEWQETLTGLQDSDTKVNRKDEELLLADKILVASKFTASTLQSFPGNLAPIKVIPYGFPTVIGKREYRNVTAAKTLKVLFVGGLSQRKGIANLFAAVEAIGPRIALTMVGQKVKECPALDNALAKHSWIPSLAHHDVLKIMKEHDVLVFPSLFEGFGLVITEAMSQGTPVITTERTAGPDLINHGENGWLVEAGSTTALIVALEELLYKPKILVEAGKAAMFSAEQRPWEIYGSELAKALMND